jgi:hydroxymethylglutaryl-CoA lyase
MDMPRIETLEQAKHFILGPKVYDGAPSPWKAPITSRQRAQAPGRQDGAEDSGVIDLVPPKTA